MATWTQAKPEEAIVLKTIVLGSSNLLVATSIRTKYRYEVSN